MRKPFFKKSHQSWFVHYSGGMIRLGPDKAEAFQKYHEQMAANAPIVSPSETVASLLNSYLNWCEKNRSPETYRWYRHFLSSFVRSVGTRMRVVALTPLHVARWIENPIWNETTRCDAVRAVRRVNSDIRLIVRVDGVGLSGAKETTARVARVVISRSTSSQPD